MKRVRSKLCMCNGKYHSPIYQKQRTSLGERSRRFSSKAASSIPTRGNCLSDNDLQQNVIFLYVSCYIAEIWITFWTVYVLYDH